MQSARALSQVRHKIPPTEPPVIDLAFHILVLLFLAAFLAGFIDSIAGGGGMITIPAMLLAGIPPLETLGTNKLQSLFGSGSATIAYARAGHVHLREQLPMAARTSHMRSTGIGISAQSSAARAAVTHHRFTNRGPSV